LCGLLLTRTNTNTMANTTSFATRLILKQHRELHMCPVVGVHATPLEENLMEWHGNVFFPSDHEYFPGLVLHFRMYFDTTYPNTSPKIRLKSTIKHSHVYGETLCFSLVPDFRDYFEGQNVPRTAYWNPARTVRTFLEDLHLFLTVDQDRHCNITAADSQHAQKLADAAQCDRCGHCKALPWPSMDSHSCVVDKETDGDNDNKGNEGGSGSSLAPSLASDTLTDLCCAMTGARFDEPGVVLGFGINFEIMRGKVTISSDFEPLSYEIFTEGKMSISTLGNPITHFLPFAVNRKHWQRAKTVLVATIATLARLVPGNRAGSNTEDRLFFVLGELWKSKAVEMMRGYEHCSEKILKGFCAIHHILLSTDADTRPQGAVAAAVPSQPANAAGSTHMQDSVYMRHASRRVSDFMRSPNNRTKRKIPDFGSFLPLLLLSRLKWSAVKLAFVEELLTRNAMWVLRSNPGLAGRVAPRLRTQGSWEPSAVGLRLTAFQVCFLSNCPEWAGEEEGADENERMLRMYERLGGRPSPTMILRFQNDAKAAQGLHDYAGFFDTVGINGLDEGSIANMLEAAVSQSASLGYHTSGNRGSGNRGRGRGQKRRW